MGQEKSFIPGYMLPRRSAPDSLKAVAKVVSNAYSVSETDMFGGGRDMHVAWAKHVMRYIYTRIVSKSERAIAKDLRIDHRAVVNSINAVETAITTYPKLAPIIERLEREATLT